MVRITDYVPPGKVITLSWAEFDRFMIDYRRCKRTHEASWLGLFFCRRFNIENDYLSTEKDNDEAVAYILSHFVNTAT